MGIDDYIAETGLARRVDADTHKSNFKKLENGLIDMMLIPESMAFFQIKKDHQESKFHFSTKPHTRYDRRLMVLSDDPKLTEFLSQMVAVMPDDPKWAEILARYK